ncbi:MAG: sulfatase-like hydrolase/transferase [Bacteroidota bacterium]
MDNQLTPGNEGHYPYPASTAALYEGIEMPEPKLSDPEIFENHPEFLKNSTNRKRFFWRWDTPEKHQTNLRAYFRMISGYDNVMKRVIAALEKKGLDKNTVIIYSADNGYYMGNRGFAGKWSHYEESLRVPLIIFDPRIPENSINKLSEKMALNIDIPATILDYAGIQQADIFQGKSLLPLLDGDENNNWREGFVQE